MYNFITKLFQKSSKKSFNFWSEKKIYDLVFSTDYFK